jgi:hypothetical protein
MDLKEVVWTGLIWLRKGRSGGYCEYGNGQLNSVKWGKVLD